MPLKLSYVNRTSKSMPCRNFTKNHRIRMASLCTMSVLVVFDSWSVRVVLMFMFALNSNFGTSGTEIELHRLCEKKMKSEVGLDFSLLGVQRLDPNF